MNKRLLQHEERATFTFDDTQTSTHTSSKHMNILPRTAILFALISLLSFAGGQMASAVNIQWAPTSGNSSWSNNASWTGGALPGSADTALFQNNGNTTQTLTANVDGNYTVTKVQIQTNTGKTGTIDLTLSGANELTTSGITLSVLGNGTSTANFTTNLTLNGTAGTRGVSANNPNTFLTFASGSTLTVASGSTLQAAGAFTAAAAGTINLNSSTFNTGNNTTALRVDAGTVNWNVGNFTSSSTNAAQIQLSGLYSTSAAAPATLNFLKSYSSGGGITLGYNASSNNSNVALYGTANNVTIAGNMNAVAAGTGGVAVNTIILGANNTSATIGNATTVTFTGNFTADTTSANSRTYNFFAAANNTAVLSGVIQGGNASASNLFQKTGAGTVTFSGSSANTYSSAISMEVVAGTLLLQKSSGNALTSNSVAVDSGATLQLGASNQISNTSAVVLSGGNLAAQSFSDTIGVLTLSGNSSISLSGGTLAFADSSAATWGSFTLDITGLVSGSSLRFGTSNSGLSSDQLSKFTASGFSTFGLDSNGFLTAVPEPTTWMLLAFSLTTVLVMRRRRA